MRGERWQTVCLDGLAPSHRLVSLRTVQQITYLTRLEAQVGDILFRTADILGTILLVCTQVRSVRKHEVVRGVAAYVAHDVAIMFHTIVLSHDSILVAVAAFDARSVCLLAHQGTHHDARRVIEVYRAALGIAVAQYALATQPSGKCAHSVDGVFSLELTVLDTEVLHDTGDVVEESHILALVVQHLHIPDDMAATVIVSFKAVDTCSDGHHQRVLQVDVGSLSNVEVAPLHDADGQDKRLQILWGSYLIRILLCAFA